MDKALGSMPCNTAILSKNYQGHLGLSLQTQVRGRCRDAAGCGSTDAIKKGFAMTAGSWVAVLQEAAACMVISGD